MARPLRFLYPNACYHVMNRGAARRRLFHGPKWYEMFLRGLEEAHERFGIEIHGYCLMPNHYHLMVRTPEANLDRAMRHVGGTYTQRYNRASNKDGALMRGRYHALVVQSEVYWARLSRYVHRNPIDCDTPLASHLLEYPWSSYRAYLDLSLTPVWLYRTLTYKHSGVTSAAKYRQFVENDSNDDMAGELLASVEGVPILGDRHFKEDHLMNRAQSFDQVSTRQRCLHTPDVETIIAAVAEAYCVDGESIRISRRGIKQANIPRAIAMYLCQTLGRCQLTRIALVFGYDSNGGVSTALHRFRNVLDSDAELRWSLECMKARIIENCMVNDET